MKTCLLAATALLFATTPLQAQEPEDASRSVTVTVSHQDLDLTRPEGRSKLDRRLRTAARSACRGTAPDGRPIVSDSSFAWMVRARCERATIAPARRAAAIAAARAERRIQLAQRPRPQ